MRSYSKKMRPGREVILLTPAPYINIMYFREKQDILKQNSEAGSFDISSMLYGMLYCEINRGEE
jgi:hypothetical protein